MNTTKETKPLDFDNLKKAVAENAAAFRSRTRLQPAGGEGDKVFPPTYAGAVYAKEDRQINGAKVPCVLLDSVQAQANRLEEALHRALDAGTLKGVPVLNVDFTGIGLLDEVGRVSSLEAPHRIADAILRDNLHAGQPFRKSELGKSLDRANLQNATPLYKLCPTALIFGLWDSTGPKGGLGAKFQRALVSEIIGVNAEIGVKTSSRIDPLRMRAAAKVIKKPDGSYELAGDKAKDGVSPSEVNPLSLAVMKKPRWIQGLAALAIGALLLVSPASAQNGRIESARLPVGRWRPICWATRRPGITRSTSRPAMI